MVHFLNENLDYSNAYQHISKGLSFFHCSPSKFQSARGKHFPNRIEILALKAKLLRELEQLIILFKLAKKLVPKNDAKEFSDVVAWIEIW